MKELGTMLCVMAGVLGAFKYATWEADDLRAQAARACKHASVEGRWGCLEDFYESRGKEVPFAAIRAEDVQRVTELQRVKVARKDLLP